jgi:serine/threonine protein kinase
VSSHFLQLFFIFSDVRGDLKLFDFGLAKLMPTDINPYEDLHKMSMAGTPRYMSPEALAGKAYNLKADVYTFSIVLWEILSLHRPFVGIRNSPALIRHVGK